MWEQFSPGERTGFKSSRSQNFWKSHKKASALESLFNVGFYWRETSTRLFSCELCIVSEGIFLRALGFSPFAAMGAYGMCTKLSAWRTCALFSEVYSAGKLRWHFTCGFDFRRFSVNSCFQRSLEQRPVRLSEKKKQIQLSNRFKKRPARASIDVSLWTFQIF